MLIFLYLVYTQISTVVSKLSPTDRYRRVYVAGIVWVVGLLTWVNKQDICLRLSVSPLRLPTRRSAPPPKANHHQVVIIADVAHADGTLPVQALQREAARRQLSCFCVQTNLLCRADNSG